MSSTLSFEALALSQNNANELLQSESVQEALVKHIHEKWVYEISEASLIMLDLCGTTKDIHLLVKSHLQLLQSKIRRQGLCEHVVSKNKIAANNLATLKKEIFKCLKSLRAMKTKPVAADIKSGCRDSMMVVVDMLRDVRMACIFVLETIFSVVSVSLSDGKSSRGRLKSLLMCGNGKVLSQDIAEEAPDRRVEALRMASEEIEVELECTFRRLLQTRVSLLNILTHS